MRRDLEPFRLSLDMVDRLAALAEQTRAAGRGVLATANYFDQGAVLVPSAWLAEIIARMDRAGLPAE